MKTLPMAQIISICKKATEHGGSYTHCHDACVDLLAALNQDDGYDYIVTAEDRSKFAPQLPTDEWRGLPSLEWRKNDEKKTFFHENLEYRRRKKPVAFGEWIAAPCRTQFPCDAHLSDGTVVAFNDWGMADEYCKRRGVTFKHHLPRTLPPPPAPEMSECEKAYRKWREIPEGDFIRNMVAYEEFKAGYEAAKVGGAK